MRFIMLETNRQGLLGLLIRLHLFLKVQLFWVILLCISPLTSANSAEYTAQVIMELVDRRDDGDKAIADLQMLLIDRNGTQRSRTFRSFGIDKEEDRLSLMFFLSPGDVKGTGFLTYDYETVEKSDDQWLYLPALKKIKLIASDDKSSSFMGSDFNYSDFTKKRLREYTYKFHPKQREVNVYDQKCWVIVSTPKTQRVIDETGYTQSVLFVRQDNYVVVRGIYSLKDEKALKYFDVKRLEQIDDIWTALEIHMSKKKGKKTVHKTILTLTDIKYNQDSVNEELFTTRQLEKGL